MANITVSKREYERLVEKALRYDYLRQAIQENIFRSPPTRESRIVLGDFQKTGKYNQKFLNSLERGLKRSSYFKTARAETHEILEFSS